MEMAMATEVEFGDGAVDGVSGTRDASEVLIAGGGKTKNITREAQVRRA
jgi:hypothetical protein